MRPVLTAVVGTWMLGPLAATAAETIDFAKQIAPIFQAHCVQCHGYDKQESGLRLDHRTPALRGGDSGPALMAGDAAKSELFVRITAEDKSARMPPPDEKIPPLSAEQISLIKQWIESGAEWPDSGEPLRVKSDHWAFQPLVQAQPPAVKREAWVRSAIDRFVLARLEKAAIEPSPPADAATLVKRLYYDLVGLPPDPQVVDAFAKDRSPAAYEKLVDDLLASPHFGERWGRHWLDKARYADSDGYEKDNPRPNAWRYRDWVISAVNRDLPFDQFTIEQLAGDLLPGATAEQKLATAFHRQTLTNTEGGADREQFRVEAIFDRVATTGAVWLGLTVGCAQCHSHKYDPISQTEFYQLFAYFNNADETKGKVSVSPTAVQKYEAQRTTYEAERKKKAETFANAKRASLAGLAAWEAGLQQRLASESKRAIQRHELAFESVTSEQKATLTRQADGSYLASGKNPDSDVYRLVTTIDVPEVTGLRLDTLTDASLGGKGPGRTPHGNFVVTQIRVFAIDGATQRELPLASGKADFSQMKFSPMGAIESAERTGWAISPQMGKNHWAEFRFAKPLPKEKVKLAIVLEQNWGHQHTLGRFKLRAITGTDEPTVSDELRKLLALAPEKRTKPQSARLEELYLATVPAVKQAADALAAFEKSAPASPYMDVDVLAERPGGRATYVLRRGDFLDPIKETKLSPGTLAVLPQPIAESENARHDRLELARWLVADNNPLTPRVTVNQVFARLFGRGLVQTINDFGARGEKPTHPELLDWLAVEFRRPASEGGLGWSRKALIKRIVMSASYQQASHHRPELAQRDPENGLLHRQNRFRVEAEIVRDLHLAASGLLSPKIGGPSVFPPMPPDVAALSYANNFKWNNSKGEDRYRRGMYTFFKRTAPHPNLITFDCPDSNTTSVARSTSNTPLQALILLNNEVFSEAAQALAKRVLEAPLGSDAARIDLAFRVCVARYPSVEEQAELLSLLEASRAWYESHPEDAKKLASQHAAAGAPASENAAWVATVRIVTNLDEFITRE